MPRVGALRLAASSAPTRLVPQLAFAARQEEEQGRLAIGPGNRIRPVGVADNPVEKWSGAISAAAQPCRVFLSLENLSLENQRAIRPRGQAVRQAVRKRCASVAHITAQTLDHPSHFVSALTHSHSHCVHYQQS